MKGTGVFITEEEQNRVQTAYDCSGMFLSGGEPMGNPGWEVAQLAKKYKAPIGTALNLKTREFVYP